jgi:predicted butyrate kinase (DUF1464 family)
MPRVAGTDPGTSSLDLLILEEGAVAGQCRFAPAEIQGDPELPVRWLRDRGPFDLIAGPSGYGLPLTPAARCTDRELAFMSLVRPYDLGPSQGVVKFTQLLWAFRGSGLPVVFLPGVIHLPTVPVHRKWNRIDLGTADKLCIAALALAQQAAKNQGDLEACNFCLVELGSAFTAGVVVRQGRVVDGLGGTSGPVGWGSGGAWDGEVAYLLSPLAKGDLFQGGLQALPEGQSRQDWLGESLVKGVAGLQAMTGFRDILLSGRLLETQTDLAASVAKELARLGMVARLESLPGAWVKHAAQGAALLADGLAGGRHSFLVERLELGRAGGTALDWICHPRGEELRRMF